jgi:hypothetical protein
MQARKGDDVWGAVRMSLSTVGAGILCPWCDDPDTRVVDTRDAKDGIRRRRKCQGCKKKFSTYESVVPPETRGAGRDLLAKRLEEGVGEIEHAVRGIRRALAEVTSSPPSHAPQGPPQPAQEMFDL